jgi:3-isopropylmalate/(R)-2-methylmalate dehydratase small subunit
VKPIRVVSGAVAALLKRIERSGFGEYLFWDWFREPGFPLNRIEFHGAPILAAGRNFGSGSSREHAAWARRSPRSRSPAAPSFSDIFRSNCTKIGLLPVELPEDAVRELLDRAPDAATIDLERQIATLPSGREVAFEIEADARERLLNGWDEIALTEKRIDEIERYEAERERDGPNTLAI